MTCEKCKFYSYDNHPMQEDYDVYCLLGQDLSELDNYCLEGCKRTNTYLNSEKALAKALKEKEVMEVEQMFVKFRI